MEKERVDVNTEEWIKKFEGNSGERTTLRNNRDNRYGEER